MTNGESEDQIPLEPDDAQKWELLLLLRRRADESGSTLRALLILLATASLAYVMEKDPTTTSNQLSLPVLSFALAIATLVWSWNLQKDKSIKRMLKLRDEGYQAFLAGEKKNKFNFMKHNNIWDNTSFFFIAFGAVSEIVTRSFGPFSIQYLIILCFVAMIVSLILIGGVAVWIAVASRVVKRIKSQCYSQSGGT